MARYHRLPQIDAALKAQQLAGGSRIGEGPGWLSICWPRTWPQTDGPAGVHAISLRFYRRRAFDRVGASPSGVHGVLVSR